jgi:hypothetical protein
MSIKNLFRLLDRINLRETGRTGIDTKILFEESTPFFLKSSTGITITGR